jgi:hypothetical protein
MNLVWRVQNLEAWVVAQRQQSASPDAPVPLDSPADVLELLAQEIHDVRTNALVDPGERARTVGVLAGLALRAMESRDVAARLEAVERVLKLRRDAEKDAANWRKKR